MDLENVIDIKKPAPDSHFRLKACGKCNGDNVAYVLRHTAIGEVWSAECFDCGHAGAPGYSRHDAQGNWNQSGREAVGA